MTVLWAALPFLLREKEAKAYLRGFPLDIPNQLYKDDAPLFWFLYFCVHFK